MTKPIRLLQVTVFTLSLFLAACGGGRSVSNEGPTEALSEYQIGPGDILQIFVWQNPEVSVTVPVRPDGMVSTPLIEEIEAVGKTPKQLARDMEAELARYIKTPQVNVIVTQFVGVFDKQIRVVGQAAQPRAIPYRQNMTVLDVMIEVGGLSETAAGNRAKIIRELPDGTTEEIKVRINDLLNKGKIEQNVRLRPGDVLMIPESVF